MTILQLDGLTVAFGGVYACKDISLEVAEREIVGVAGPNGSGKSTMFRATCGDVRSSAGRVLWGGTDITGWSTDRIARQGLIRTFQNSTMFASTTVLENLRMAQLCGPRRRASSGTRLPESADEIAGVCHLDPILKSPARILTTGQLRMLGIAMALMARPEMLLLDEPAAGLSITEGRDLAILLRELNMAGLTLMVVDHDMSFLLPLCHRLVVLEAGSKFTEGVPREVAANPDVVRMYLGSRFAEGKNSQVLTHPDSEEASL